MFSIYVLVSLSARRKRGIHSLIHPRIGTQLWVWYSCIGSGREITWARTRYAHNPKVFSTPPLIPVATRREQSMHSARKSSPLTLIKLFSNGDCGSGFPRLHNALQSNVHDAKVRGSF